MGLCRSMTRQPPRKAEAAEIRQAIPMNRDRAQRDRNGVNIGVGHHLFVSAASEKYIEPSLAQRRSLMLPSLPEPT